VYLCDVCDHAGIWEVDIELAEFMLGVELSDSKAREVFGKKILPICEGGKWWIPDFIEFQYGCSVEKLNPGNNAHKSAISILEKYDLKAAPNEPLMSPSRGDQEKEMEKEMEKEKEDRLLSEKLFEQFWTVYPTRNGKKVGKKSAKEKFKKLPVEDLPRVIRNAENYGINNEFAKDPERFLKNDFWKDWDEPQTKGSANGSDSYRHAKAAGEYPEQLSL
jgi:hypothetical protein